MIKDLGIELARCPYTTAIFSDQKVALEASTDIPNVAVNDLSHAKCALIGHKIERLRFHARTLHGLPFQVIRRKFCEGNGFCLRSDGLNRRRAILWLLSSCNIR
jgi:hypothetical protein